MSTPVPLADFPPTVARAVAIVLRRAGIPATIIGDTGANVPEDVTIVVPDDRREEALRTMANSMEDIQAEQAKATAPPVAVPRSTGESSDSEDEGGPPLLFERLRGLGFLPVLLVPLLVVTLARINLPTVYTVALIIGGMAALIAWRDGRRRRDGD